MQRGILRYSDLVTVGLSEWEGMARLWSPLNAEYQGKSDLRENLQPACRLRGLSLAIVCLVCVRRSSFTPEWPFSARLMYVNGK